MAEANYVNDGLMIDYTPTAAITAGQVIQLNDGRAAFAPDAIAAGAKGAVQVRGICEVAKTTTMVVLIGSKLYWDHSANKAHLLHRNDRDFYLGCAQEDGASAGTTIKVALNEQPVPTLSLANGFSSLPVAAAGINHHIIGHGDGVSMIFDLTAEAQKLDALSHRGLAIGCKAIVDALISINVNGDDAAFDLNVGLANATHATDADSITESLFVHVDGNSLNILLESDDGTTEVAATDTTVDAVLLTPFLVQFDLRNLADIQAYIDGVNVLPNSVFKLDAATGPLKLLVHMEKTANDSPGSVTVLELVARAAEGNP